LQESDFNLAESSIQALSNSFTLTRGEKVHSPHTSPKLLRKNAVAFPTTPQDTSSSTTTKVANQSHTKSQKTAITSSGSTSSTSSVSSSTTTASSSNNSINRTPPVEPIIDLFAACSNDDAPPIPPRKSQTHSNEVNRSLKPQPVLPTSTTAIVTPTVPPLLQQLHHQQAPALPPTDNYENHQIPEQQPKPKPIFLAEEEDYDDDDDDSNPILGPAETITGIIDTRPLEQRTNYISFASLTNNVTSNFNLITINDTSSGTKDAQLPAPQASSATSTATTTTTNGDSSSKINSNTYLLKGNGNQLNNNFSNFNGTNANNHHQRHMSVPVGGQTPAKTLPTSSSTFQASINHQQQAPAVNSPFKISGGASNGLLYENVKMKTSSGNLIALNNINNNSSSSNVPYENINLEYINRLMKEGYSKENVVAALGISRNNFEMACDILHEFVSTNQNHATKVCDNLNR